MTDEGFDPTLEFGDPIFKLFWMIAAFIFPPMGRCNNLRIPLCMYSDTIVVWMCYRLEFG
jgi:hypothetical protein